MLYNNSATWISAYQTHGVKFKLDENMPADAAKQLRADGHDVMDVVEEGLGGEDDPPVLRAATAEKRILLTYDLAFNAFANGLFQPAALNLLQPIPVC